MLTADRSRARCATRYGGAVYAVNVHGMDNDTDTWVRFVHTTIAGSAELPAGATDLGDNSWLDPLFCGPSALDPWTLDAASPCRAGRRPDDYRTSISFCRATRPPASRRAT